MYFFKTELVVLRLAVYRICLKCNLKTQVFHGSQPSMAGCHSLLVRSLSSLQLTGLDDSVTDPGTVQNPLHSSSPSNTPFILGGAGALQVLMPTPVATMKPKLLVGSPDVPSSVYLLLWTN